MKARIHNYMLIGNDVGAERADYIYFFFNLFFRGDTHKQGDGGLESVRGCERHSEGTD